MLHSSTPGSEIHRLKVFDHVDDQRFRKIYKSCKPLIRRLSSEIDVRRYNVTRDIIRSYFDDKFMFVYYKYQDKYDDNRLKATILSSLSVYKNKLLRNAYTQKAEFNQDLTSFEDLYEDSKEFIDDDDEVNYKESLSIQFNDYLKEHLTGDEYLLFRTELNPPPFFEDRIKKSHGKLSILHLIEFFELPKTKKSHKILTKMRKNIKEVLELAKAEFHYKW